MSYRNELTTEDDPVGQAEIDELIAKGYAVDLLIQNGEVIDGQNQYYLYVKYRGNLRPVYTQRNAHRAFNNIKRAVDWGKRLGFKYGSISIDFSKII